MINFLKNTFAAYAEPVIYVHAVPAIMLGLSVQGYVEDAVDFMYDGAERVAMEGAANGQCKVDAIKAGLEADTIVGQWIEIDQRCPM